MVMVPVKTIYGLRPAARIALLLALLTCVFNLKGLLDVTQQPREEGRQDDASHPEKSLAEHKHGDETPTKPSLPLKSPLNDPKHTPRLHPFTNMSAFPLPKFHSCTERGLCKLSNVCFSNKDGMLVFEVPGLDIKAYSDRFYEYDPLLLAVKPWVIPKEAYLNLKNVFFTKSLLVLNCYYQPADNFNPFHTLAAFGKLLATSTGDYGPGQNYTFDMLLYHKCPNFDSWPWAREVDKMIFADAANKGLITTPFSSENDVKLILPHVFSHPSVLLDQDVVICGETVYQDPTTNYNWFGGNAPSVISRWRSLLQNYIEEAAHKNDTTTATNNNNKIAPSSAKDNLRQPHIYSSCSRSLRVAVYRRSGGTALRKFVNLRDVEELVKEYSDRPPTIVTTGVSMPLRDQMSIFRSFDILITPHGSHLTNMVLGSNSTAYIVLTPVYIDNKISRQAHLWLKKYIESFGHMPYNVSKRSRKAMVRSCSRHFPGLEAFSPCPWPYKYSEFLQTDLVVNITTLRGDLETAIEALCSETL